MPLAAGTTALASGFLPLFSPGQPTTAGAANTWASAYFAYSLFANATPIPARKSILASSLTNAFNPELLGGGRALFLAALASFWIGTPALVPLGSVGIFIPSGSIDSSVADDATPQEQAQALANLIHQLTISSVWVIPSPPAAPTPVLIT